MLKNIAVVAVLAAASHSTACTYHPPGSANGAVRLHLTPPTGLVAALPEGAFPGSVSSAGRCEAGDYAACTRLGFFYDNGAASPFMKYCGTGSGHGDDHAADDHAADDHAADDHGDDHAADDHGDDHAADDHGDDHAADDHAADDHGGGHGGGGCMDSHGHEVPVGTALPHDAATARSLYIAACEGGWLTSCARAGEMALDAEGGAADPDLGSRYMNRACSGGVGAACVELAGRMRAGTVAGGEAAARQAMRTACLTGIATACESPVALAAAANTDALLLQAVDHAHAVEGSAVVAAEGSAAEGSAAAPAADPHAGHDHAGHDHAGHEGHGH